MFKLFEIKDGKFSAIPALNPKNFKNFLIASLILLAVMSLSHFLKFDEKDAWKLYNLIIQQFGLKQSAPKIQREKEIEARIEIEVDSAIQKYNRLTGDDERVKLIKPTYVEKPIDESSCYTKECQSLGGEMRLCAPWVYDCPKEMRKVDRVVDGGSLENY